MSQTFEASPERALARFQPATMWSAYTPTATNRWDLAKVGHLYRRAVGGAPLAQLQSALQKSPGEIVTELVRGGADQQQFEEQIARLRESVLQTNDPQQVKALWLYRLIHSPHALRERMTLFWHNHFATSNAKVANLRLMQQQNETIRQHALGHFDDLLQGLTRDPAMLVWLDSSANQKGQPNENYAREVFELFSLGVGNYTEKDIQEAARALTGWTVRNGQAEFQTPLFDDGEKTILGQTGRWGAGDVVRIALAQPACASFLVHKLYRYLVSETVTPSEEQLAPLVEGFRLRNFDISWLVERMLSSWVFYSPASIGQCIKPPVDFIVGTIRSLGGSVGTVRLAEVCDRLGQSLFYPPSVKGWEGGTLWINSTALLYRQNLAFELTRGTGLGSRTDPARSVDLDQPIDELRLADTFLELFQPQVNVISVREQIASHLREERRQLQQEFQSSRSLHAKLSRTAAHLVLTLPEYQIA